MACDEAVAGIMITNPNTLGLFEEHIEEVVRSVHGAADSSMAMAPTVNALAGIARPGDLGFDVIHPQSAQDVLDAPWWRWAEPGHWRLDASKFCPDHW